MVSVIRKQEPSQVSLVTRKRASFSMYLLPSLRYGVATMSEEELVVGTLARVKKRALFAPHRDGDVREDEPLNYVDDGDVVIVLSSPIGGYHHDGVLFLGRRVRCVSRFGVGYVRHNVLELLPKHFPGATSYVKVLGPTGVIQLSLSDFEQVSSVKVGT